MKQCCKAYLTEQFGDEDVINEIYSEYAKSMQEKIPELEAALTAENWAVLDTLAHAVKGNALATGDNDSANAAIALRIAAKMSNKDEAHTHFEELKKFAAEI
ncbi:MAG: Hpt domain-containing protein [Lentisphaerae bacterium]|nr:Hpt domain-containing protein [Lentisphaerota bacterium]